MKKIICLFLTLIMVFSMSVVAFGAAVCGQCDNVLIDCLGCNGLESYCSTCDFCDFCDYTSALGDIGSDSEEYETIVSYTGEGVSFYEISVPAYLTPGESGEIELEGSWPTTQVIEITAPSTVILTNNLDGGKKVLDVDFEGIYQIGDNEDSIYVSEPIYIESITRALFGTWTGSSVYSVSVTNSK